MADDVTACQVEYGLDQSLRDRKSPCAPDPASAPPASNFNTDTDVSGEMTGLTPDRVYHYRFVGGNHSARTSASTGGPWSPPTYSSSTPCPPSGIRNQQSHAERLPRPGRHGHTTYHFEYGSTTDYGQLTPEEAGGSTAGVKPVAKPVTGLPQRQDLPLPDRGTNDNGITYGPDLTFRTGSPPDIGGVNATELAATSATINALINPTGYETTYKFEYGPTPDYGQSTPATPASIGSGTEPIDVTRQLTGLQSGITYHYRVVATNVWGTAVSPDTTFDFAPPSCPNAHVRQQTKSAYLPDCRAYEIVSPGAAGSVLFFPSNFLWSNAPSARVLRPAGSGQSTRDSRISPPRFATGVASVAWRGSTRRTPKPTCTWRRGPRAVG